MPGDFDLSWWGFRAAASFCRPISICKPVGEAEVDSLCAAMHVLPVSSFLVCPKFLGLHQEFSCQRFPSLVERRELCRYTSCKARTLPHRPTFVACAIRTWSRRTFW